MSIMSWIFVFISSFGLFFVWYYWVVHETRSLDPEEKEKSKANVAGGYTHTCEPRSGNSHRTVRGVPAGITMSVIVGIVCFAIFALESTSFWRSPELSTRIKVLSTIGFAGGAILLCFIVAQMAGIFFEHLWPFIP